MVEANPSDSNVAHIEQELDFKISQSKVVIFSKSYCPHCNSAKALLRDKGVGFKAYELDNMQYG